MYSFIYTLIWKDGFAANVELFFLVLDLEEKHVVDVIIQIDIVSDLGGIKWKKKKNGKRKKEDEVYGNAIQVFQVYLIVDI